MNFIGKNQLEHWGKEASREFLQNQVPLNESIEKIAHEYSLNGEQIKRVCEFANISTNLSLFEKCADKRFEFDQANHEELISSLGGSQEKTASDSGVNEYDFPLDLRMGIYRSENLEVAGDGEEDSEKTASEDDRNLFHEKIAGMTADELVDELDARQAAIADMEYDRDKVAHSLDLCREHLRDEFQQILLEKQASFELLTAGGMACFEDPHSQNAAREELLKIGYELHQKGIVGKDELKKLAYSVPSSYISEHLESPGAPFLVRNGRQTTWSILDTLVKQRDKPAEYDKPLLLLNDDVKYIKRQLTG